MKVATFDPDRKVWVQEIAQKEFYSVQDVNTILHTGGPSVRNSIKRGTMRGYRVGGIVKVKHEDLMAYIARRGQVSVAGYGDLIIEEIIPQGRRSQADVAAELVEGLAGSISGGDLNFLNAE